MPQWRKMHLKMIESDDVINMPDDFTRFLWVMLIMIADREGRGRRNPLWIRSKAFPTRLDVTLDQVDAAMDWMAGRGMIAIYFSGEDDYFQICSFHRYQNTAKEAESLFPADPNGSSMAAELVENKSGATPELVQSKSRVSPELLQS